MNNDQQCVRCNQTQSEFAILKAGVPQGNKLGPIIFQIVINDAARGCCSMYWKYVDDLTFAENRTRGLSSNLQRDLDDFLGWSINNQLKLNPDKCLGLQIAFGRNPPQPNLSMGNTPLKFVPSAKILSMSIKMLPGASSC